MQQQSVIFVETVEGLHKTLHVLSQAVEEGKRNQ